MLFLAVSISLTAAIWDIMRPLPPSRLEYLSHVILDEKGSVLETRLSRDGYWREKIDLDDIDERLVNILIAYEDKRFWDHYGVDILAITRAIYDASRTGKISSGASTITMQTARLMYPSLGKKNLLTKLKQMLMALRIEFHWTKSQILEAYFTLAPYGGNIEGISAGTRAWLNRSPKHLTYREASFFVALPQSPETRRPDRHRGVAERTTSRVLAEVAGPLLIDTQQIKEYQSETIPLRKTQLLVGDSHLIDRLSTKYGGKIQSNIDGEWQARVKSILERHVASLDLPYNGAVMIVERKTGRVRTYLGSTSYRNVLRKGANNYLQAVRSPGSTLKPLIYGMALERGLLKPNSIMLDTAIQVDGYAPTNFDDSFHGKVRLKDALIRSLNIPAINTLERIGTERVIATISQYLVLPSSQVNDPGLSLAVGGLYLTPEQLAQIYLGLTEQPSANLSFITTENAEYRTALLTKWSSDQLLSLLSQVDLGGARYIVKTGTSNGRRDAWSVHVTKDHIVLVWIGAPDNQANQRLSGISTAAPIGKDIILSLQLEDPSVTTTPYGDSRSYTRSESICKRLIEYPELDEWIISSSDRISIASRYSGLIWYLNGERTSVADGTIRLKHYGANTLSARKDDCVTSHSIFVSFED